MPRISILMPFYNVEKFISSAIKSVISQTYTDWELLLVDDGSTDSSLAVAEKFAGRDNRIRLFQNPRNMGIARSCNHAFAMAGGEFIARCDADDLAMPERFERQLSAALERPQIGVWGCGAYHMGDNEKRLFIRKTDPVTATISLLFYIPIVNTTFFARRSVLDKVTPLYDSSVMFEDYELLVRLAGMTQICNLHEPLMYIRANSGSYTSGISMDVHFRHFLSYQEKLIRSMGVEPTNHELAMHGEISRYMQTVHHEGNFHDMLDSLPHEEDVRAWFARLNEGNDRVRLFGQKELSSYLDEVAWCFRSTRQSPPPPTLLQKAGSWLRRL